MDEQLLSQVLLSTINNVDFVAAFNPFSRMPGSSLVTTIVSHPILGADPFGSTVESLVPITTLDFPLTRHARSVANTRPRRHSIIPPNLSKRRRVPQEEDGCCCICLEPLGTGTASLLGQLPGCNHVFHNHCLWGVLNSATLGASSMMRCPLCRSPIDRHDLAGMGWNVKPRTLRCVASACNAYRSLLESHHAVPRGTFVAKAILAAASLTAADGFVYNTCVLALERMLRHKRSLVQSIKQQLGSRHRSRMFDRCDFIDSCLACHVDVLIHTANHVEPAVDFMHL
jgi:hypothetical protein